jgi:FAD/FMN-containing dehydrogenase
MQHITEKEEIQEWFSERTWSFSGNKAAATDDVPTSQSAGRVVFPKSTQGVADILSSSQLPIAVVCGGHSSSNTSTVACHDAIVIDLQHLNDEICINKESMQITVGGGTTFRPLAEAVAEAGGALPIGTGEWRRIGILWAAFGNVGAACHRADFSDGRWRHPDLGPKRW